MMGPHRKYLAIVSGVQRALIEPLRFVPVGRANVEDDFGTAADPRRALSTDRRFVSTNDDRGHAGRAA